MSERPNLMAPEYRHNPYPLYARLRREAPVCQVEPRGLWLLTRQDDVLHALKHPELFSSAALGQALEVPWLGRPNPLSFAMSFADPPRHGRLRSLVQRAFSPAAMARLESLVRSVTERLADELVERRQVDFIQAFALPLPASVIGSLLGLDTSVYTQVKRWAEDIVGLNAVPAEALERQAQVRASLGELMRYLEEAVEERRRQPRQDMVSELVQARVEGEALTQDELLGFLFLLLVAGLETTVHLLGHAVRLLRELPEVLARVRAEPALVPRFVEEVLRYEPPVQGPLRVTTAEVEVGGVRIPAHALVMPLTASALRDERYVVDGERFDLEREQGPSHLAFGHGPHFCLGAALTRLEARVALEVLLARCRGFGGRPEEVVWSRSLAVRGPQVLPVEVLPA